MTTPLADFSADHRFLLSRVAEIAGIPEPVAIDLDEFAEPLLKRSKRGPIMPLDGVLIRDWDPDNRKVYPGIQIGMRLYEVDGITFARVQFNHDDARNCWAFNFTAVAKRDYLKLYKIAVKSRRDGEPAAEPPVMPAALFDVLWKNTIAYLEKPNLRRIKSFGGRARRGLLLMGPPGNGKTSACRWLWQECRRRNYEWHLVSPDAYSSARRSPNPVQAVRELFTVEKHGIVFFDDMDLALRDRETVHETDDQSVFLNALDGITVQEGVVFVFTTNCGLGLIDRAFKRPGRIDVVLSFDPPNAELRRKLIDRWHQEVRNGIDIEAAVDSTDGYSFAEIEEVKNLLILNYADENQWDWEWAMRQFQINRSELAPKKTSLGFAGVNGHHD